MPISPFRGLGHPSAFGHPMEGYSRELFGGLREAEPTPQNAAEPRPLLVGGIPLRPMEEIPRLQAPALDVLSRIDANTWEAGEARGPVTIGFAAEGGAARILEQANALRVRTQEIFGKEIDLGAFEGLVDAPPDSKVVVDVEGEKLTAEVFDAADLSKVLEKLTFDKQEDGSVLLVHDVDRAGTHAGLAPVFGDDTTHGANIFGKPVVEQWRASKGSNGYYAETLDNGTVIRTMDRDALNASVKQLFKDPETRAALTKPLNAEQLNELLFLPEGADATLSGRASRVDVGVKHPNFAADTRDYTADATGKVIFHQGLARVNREHGQATGLGRETFLQAIGASHKYGVHAIRAQAAGSGNGTDHVADGSFVGFYTWPRLGFNGEITAVKRQAMPPELSGARDMLDLFSREGGPQWWKQNGSSLTVEYLLDPDGPNVAATQRYALEKQAAAQARAANG